MGNVREADVGGDLCDGHAMNFLGADCNTCLYYSINRNLFNFFRPFYPKSIGL